MSLTKGINCLIIQSYHSPILDANIIWSPIISNTNIKKLQIIQNTALRIATGCKRDINTQHLHDETKVLPIDTHLKLYATQLKQVTLTQKHSFVLNAYSDPPRNMKATIFIIMSTLTSLSQNQT